MLTSRIRSFAVTVTMTTVGYGDKAPVTRAGRTIALIWMFASVLTISSFTAAVASALTVDRLGARVRSSTDLALIRVADAVVYDAPVLRAGVLATNDGTLTVLPDVMADENYAFAFPPGSAQFHALDLALLAEIESDEWHALLERFLGVVR
jgi:hypothetical protein